MSPQQLSSFNGREQPRPRSSTSQAVGLRGIGAFCGVDLVQARVSANVGMSERKQHANKTIKIKVILLFGCILATHWLPTSHDIGSFACDILPLWDGKTTRISENDPQSMPDVPDLAVSERQFA